ncbi:MAG: hypothetical protein ACKN9K_23000, partial [Dolichospermum sp.]
LSQPTPTNNLPLTQTITNELDLDSHNTIWDTEAPVVVVNNHYPSIPIHHNLIDSDISIDEFNNSLLEIPEPITSSSDQKTMSLSELLNRHPAPIPTPIPTP